MQRPGVNWRRQLRRRLPAEDQISTPMDELAENWQLRARKEQCEFYSTWGRRVAWRGVPAEQRQSLQLMIALHLFHKTADDENHTVADLVMTKQERAATHILANKVHTIHFIQTTLSTIIVMI
jgi:hypothetical protein